MPNPTRSGRPVGHPPLYGEKMKSIQVRLPGAMLDGVDVYAHRHCDGNRTQAIREMLALCLSMDMRRQALEREE